MGTNYLRKKLIHQLIVISYRDRKTEIRFVMRSSVRTLLYPQRERYEKGVFHTYIGTKRNPFSYLGIFFAPGMKKLKSSLVALTADSPFWHLLEESTLAPALRSTTLRYPKLYYSGIIQKQRNAVNIIL
jgi:hypothetical protein